MWVVCIREGGKTLIKNKTGKNSTSCKVISRKATDLV